MNRASGPRAELRTLRLCTGVVGASTLAATVATSVVVTQPDRLTTNTSSPWVVTMVAIVLPLLAAVSAPWSDLRTLRWLNSVVVVEYGVLYAVLALSAASGRINDGELPWSITFTASPVAAALVAWGPSGARLVLLGSTAAIQVLRAEVGHDTRSALASDVQAFFASLTLVLLFGILVEASREFDRSTAAAYERTSRRSAEEARTSVRRRLQTLVHDELLATLVLAARDTGLLRSAIATQAARARQLLDELHTPDGGDTVPVDHLVDRLRADVTEIAADAHLEVDDARHADPRSQRLDRDVAEALQGAFRQALANSRVHAGPGACRSVRVTVDDDGVVAVIEDDGVGFDPARVPATRLGVSSSIIGRLRGVPGGDARVESTPGTGTRVTLRWSRIWVRAGVAVARPADRGGILADSDRLRRGALVVVGVFWLAQTCLAVIAGSVAGDPWVATLAAFGVGTGLLSIGWSSLEAPSRARTWLTTGIAVATAALSLVPIERDPVRYGDTWYVAASGFVLLALAIRGRPGAAALGGLVAVATALTGAAVQANDAPDVLASSTRHGVVLTIGVLLLLGIRRTRARTDAVHAEELREVQAESFREAAVRELQERSRALEDVIGEMLGRLESGDELTVAERRECAALEGRLRDQYRGGRIARPPLTETAMAARRRGIDVVLLDDAPDRPLADPELDAIAAWLAQLLDSMTDGRFTGRILPTGRGGYASAVTGDDVVELHELDLAITG